MTVCRGPSATATTATPSLAPPGDLAEGNGHVLRADDDERGGAAHGLALESFGLRCVYAGDISSGQDALARDHYGAA